MAERHERGDALAVRRDLVHRLAAEADVDRLDPGAAVLAQVGGRHAPPRARSRTSTIASARRPS